MPKKVLLVGHCIPDASYLRSAVSAAFPGATVSSIDDDSQLSHALSTAPDLLLVNRVLFGDFAKPGGIELIRSLRQINPNLKLMLISNYPDAQAEAVAAGAQPGFGKKDLGKPASVSAIRGAL